jgi:hypothetical protein
MNCAYFERIVRLNTDKPEFTRRNRKSNHQNSQNIHWERIGQSLPPENRNKCETRQDSKLHNWLAMRILNLFEFRFRVLETRELGGTDEMRPITCLHRFIGGSTPSQRLPSPAHYLRQLHPTHSHLRYEVASNDGDGERSSLGRKQRSTAHKVNLTELG